MVQAVVVLNDLRQQVPEWVLRRAKGIAILNMAQGGFGVGLKAGTGLMVSRTMVGKRDGSWWNQETEWSPPIAIFCTGFSIGFQVGGQVCHSREPLSAP
jgi:lipid-binding SYLF domain-containing protein